MNMKKTCIISYILFYSLTAGGQCKNVTKESKNCMNMCHLGNPGCDHNVLLNLPSHVYMI